MKTCFETCGATMTWYHWVIVFVIALPWMGLIYNGLMHGLGRVARYVTKKYRFPYDGK